MKTKICTKCLIEKQENKFEYQRNACYACKNKMKKKLNNPVLVSEKCCPKCNEIKSSDNFSKNSGRPTGLHDYCKPCDSEMKKINYLKNPGPARQRAAQQYLKVRGTEDYRQKANKRQKERLKADPKYLLTRRLRNRLYYALQKKSWKKNTKFYEYIGCDLEFLKSHIQALFIGGMSWDNHGEWHIDHIVPLDSANSEEELYKLCHYSNLQPMWAEDNLSKGNKI